MENNQLEFHSLETELFWIYDIRINNDEVCIDVRHGKVVGIRIDKSKNKNDVYIEYLTKVTEDGPVSFISHSKSFLTEKEAVIFYLDKQIKEAKDITENYFEILNVYENHLRNYLI